MVPIVTAINEAYFPGLDALYNSFKANVGPEFDFHCIVDGDEDLFARVRALGVNAVKPINWAEDYPVSPWWREKIPSLFARLQIPRLFPDHERALWIDADCIILDPLTRLAEVVFNEPVAACRPSVDRYILSDMLINCPPHLSNTAGLFSGLMVFNIPEWNKLDITGLCAKTMLIKGITFKWGDQSVLSYVLAGNFFELSMKWQTFAHRTDANFKAARIMHWLGDVPWEKEMRNGDRWYAYATKEE